MAEAWIEIAGDDRSVDAFVAAPDGRIRAAPVVLLAAEGEAERLARRIAAHGYYVLAPRWAHRCGADRRDDVEAWFDHLAGARACDDRRVAVVGLAEGADLALRLATWRAERIVAVAAFGGQGLGPAAAADVAQRLNAVIRVGYPIGRPSGRIGVLETALALAGVDFEIEIYDAEPDWPSLLDLLARTLSEPLPTPVRLLAAPDSTEGRPL